MKKSTALNIDLKTNLRTIYLRAPMLADTNSFNLSKDHAQDVTALARRPICFNLFPFQKKTPSICVIVDDEQNWADNGHSSITFACPGHDCFSWRVMTSARHENQPPCLRMTGIVFTFSGDLSHGDGKVPTLVVCSVSLEHMGLPAQEFVLEMRMW